MTEQEILQSGIAALKAGDKQRARSILARAVQQYPQSERGWYLLGLCMDSDEKRAYCFERVLEINPYNQDAKKQFSLLPLSQATPPAPAFSQPEAPVPVEQLIRFQPALETETEERRPSEITTSIPKKKKQNNNIIFISVAGGLCILSITAAAAFMMFANVFRNPAPPLPTATLRIPTSNAPLPTASPETAAPLPTARPTMVYTPGYEPAPCPFEAPSDASVSCGYAIVPENRAVNNGRTLRLAVAVFRSRSRNPSPDPVLFLQGGPGGQAVQLSADAYSILVQPFLSTRDYITFDQRGTGFSEPKMTCDELDKIHRQDIYGAIPIESREFAYQSAFIFCGGLLQAQGIDLSAYSTVESAADLRDIVQLLGYQKVNLYGISYGTRLALVTMRNHPEIVRSAILDSVVPVETNVIEEYPESVNSALSQMFASCAADPNCARAYPDLQEVFWSLVQQLDANPITLTTSAYPIGTVTETVNGSYLLSVITGLLRNADFIPTTPQTVYRVRGGDYSTLIAAQYSLPYEFDGISPGLYISMMCREHVLDSTPQELSLISDEVKVNEKVFRPFYGDFSDMYSGCKTWGSAGPDLGEKDAVVSDIPSFVLAGSFDPATPPFYGKQAAANLTHGYYFEFPTRGHAVTTDDLCARQAVLDFLSNPDVEPDRSCVNGIQPVNFLVPYTGDPPLDLERERIHGVSVDVPRGWSFTSDGFFARGSSVFDITQVSVFRDRIRAQDLVDYFSSSINGYRGLDGAPTAAGTRNANGYEWNLYFATSNDRPVDIAVADDDGEALVIVMFCHPDEHDALYRTLFLPMIDSAR